MSDIMNSNFTARFGELVDDLVAHGTQRVDIAKRLGVSKQTVSAWTTGERTPKRPAIIAIAQAFDVNIAWLHGYNVPRNRVAPASTADERMKEFDALFSKLTADEQVLILQAMKGIAAGK